MLWLSELAVRRRAALASLTALAVGSAAALGAFIQACYSTGDGTSPPSNTFYFPVGLAVSVGGNVLYVANSDFDLQWNGGTIQSYDLNGIRHDAAISAAGFPLSSVLPVLPPLPAAGSACPYGLPTFYADGGLISPCAPIVDSTTYVRDTATIGAFATDIQLSPWGNRLYAPVRGDASLTWASVVPDDATVAPGRSQVACHGSNAANCYAPFSLECGQQANGGRCDATHHAGVNPNEPGNTRNLTMPGEPFAMAQSADGTAIVMTHQSEGDTSLFLTGLSADGGPASPNTPSMQFVVDAGLPMGGDGIASVPHDPAAYGYGPNACSAPVVSGAPVACPDLPRPAFLETNNTVAQLNLIRYYADDGTTIIADASAPDANVFAGFTTFQRPYIEVERTYSITTNSSGTDSRGIAIDPTPRIRCEASYAPTDARYSECARLPAPVYIANRAPYSLIYGSIGHQSPTDPNPDRFDADALSLEGNISLQAGPSRVYLAPIIDADGNYALRVFVVCFDNNAIWIVDPVTKTVESVIGVGAGPFAITFDPFTLAEVALNAPVPVDTRPYQTQNGATPPATPPLHKYRFAYVASFTNSYMQVIDLDNSGKNKQSFETVVYTLGTPSVPKGNQ